MELRRGQLFPRNPRRQKQVYCVIRITTMYYRAVCMGGCRMFIRITVVVWLHRQLAGRNKVPVEAARPPAPAEALDTPSWRADPFTPAHFLFLVCVWVETEPYKCADDFPRAVLSTLLRQSKQEATRRPALFAQEKEPAGRAEEERAEVGVGTLVQPRHAGGTTGGCCLRGSTEPADTWYGGGRCLRDQEEPRRASSRLADV